MHNNSSNKLAMTEIFKLARYDIKNNLSSWVKLLTMQACIILLLKLSIFIPEVSNLSSLTKITSFFFHFNEIFNTLSWDTTSTLFCCKIILNIIAFLFMTIISPMIILQNALDLAFDSTMRGFSFKGRILLYSLSALLINGYIEFVFNLMLYEPSASIFLIPCSIYLFQITRFIGCHILEYNCNLIDAIKASYKISHNRIYYLTIITMRQLLIMAGGIISFLGIFAIICTLCYTLLSNEASQEFFSAASQNNLFHDILSAIYSIWILPSIMWIISIEGHLYRQLICPPSQQAGCQSCKC